MTSYLLLNTFFFPYYNIPSVDLPTRKRHGFRGAPEPRAARRHQDAPTRSCRRVWLRALTRSPAVLAELVSPFMLQVRHDHFNKRIPCRNNAEIADPFPELVRR